MKTSSPTRLFQTFIALFLAMFAFIANAGAEPQKPAVDGKTIAEMSAPAVMKIDSKVDLMPTGVKHTIGGTEVHLFSTAKINIAYTAWKDAGYDMLGADKVPEFMNKADVKAKLMEIEKNGRRPYMLIALNKPSAGQKTTSVESAKPANSTSGGQ